MNKPVTTAAEAIEGKFIEAVWDALKTDANDLRKEKRILNAFREAIRALDLDKILKEVRKD